MKSTEPWVEKPLDSFLTESAARVVLLMTPSGQVIAQHGFAKSLDVMSAAALGAGVLASTEELGRVMGGELTGPIVHQGTGQGILLRAMLLPDAKYLVLVVYGKETSLGLVTLFLDRLAVDLAKYAPAKPKNQALLAENFERELNSSLQALFGR